MSTKAQENTPSNIAPLTEKSVRSRAVKALLSLATTRDWRDIHMEDIADESGVCLPELYEYFDDRDDILAAYGRILDRKMLDGASPTQEGTSARDALFDLLMERFDIMNEDRESLIAILKGVRFDPKGAALSLPHLGRSMARILEAAGFVTEGPAGALKIMGLTMVYLDTMRHWMDDESPDMGKTMAALDKNLTRAGELANTLRLGGAD